MDKSIVVKSMDIKLSVVILAMTNSFDLYKMTVDCIESLVSSESEVVMEILVVESNKNYRSEKFQYPDYVKVIIPDGTFNFHKFLNIGIKVSRGEFVALCNNDLLFHKNWFTEILNIKQENPSIKSFSPNAVDGGFTSDKRFEIGYKVQSHVKGWCLVAERSIFIKIGYLDELFDFYYADNDYAMSLKLHNIKHAVVFNSYVEHLEKRSSGSILDPNKGLEMIQKYSIPSYLFLENYKHITQNEKALQGFLKFYSKWGSPKWVYRKNKIAETLFKYNLGYFAKFLYHYKKNVNIFKDS